MTILWVQIDGAPIFLSSSIILSLHYVSLPPSFLSYASSPFGVPAILSRFKLVRVFGCKASPYHFTEKDLLPSVLHRRRAHFYHEKNRGVRRKINVAVDMP